MAETQEKIVRIMIDASGAKEGGQAVERALKSIDDRIDALGQSIASSFSGIRNVILGALSFDQVMTQIRGLTEAFDRLGSRARVLGTTVEWMQAFEYAAASNTVKLEAATGALEKFQRVVGEAALGNKQAVETLNQLGVKSLDADRQMRPLNEQFVDAARKLSSLEGTAKGAALGVAAMGRDFQRVAPMMADVAKGSDSMVAAAQKAGSIVNRETVKIWEDLATASDKAMLRWRSFAGENFADSVKKGFDLVGSSIISALEKLNRFAALLGRVWEEAKQFAREQTAKDIREDLSDTERQLRAIDGKILDQNRKVAAAERIATRHPGVGGINLDNLAKERAALDKLNGTQTWLLTDRDRQNARILGLSLPSAELPPVVTSTEWGGKPAAGAGGGGAGTYSLTAADPGQGDRLAKRIELLREEATAQKAMADAALQGAAAVAEQEAKWKAVKDALAVYGDQAKATDPKVQSLARQFLELNRVIDQNKAVTQFRLQTEDLDRQNAVLEKRLEYMNAAPEVLAREVGILQARNEAAKTGARISAEDLASRGKAIETQEILNQKLQDAQRATDLWLQPIKSMLSSVQQTAANMWENILTNGKFSMQEFGQLFAQTAKRAAAELLALATVRPVIGFAVEGLSSLGLVSGQTARALGYGGGGGMGLPGQGGGGLMGGMSMPGGLGGGGGFGGMFGNVGQWLNTPFMGPWSGISPVGPGVYGPAPNIGSTASMWNPSSWSITPMQGIGALAGIGSGIYQLATGGGSTGSMIGGIGSMIGAGVSLIPGIGQIAGPLISMASAFLPSLFGDGKPKYVDNQAYGQLSYGGGGWSTSGGAWGPSADARSLQGPLGQLGQGLDGIFGMLGGVKDASKVWGMASETSSRTGGGWDLQQNWSYLIDPATGGKSLWRAGEGNMLDSGGAQVAVRSILGGAVGEITDSMRTAVYTVGQRGSSGSLQQVGEAVNFVTNVYEKLGKSTASAADAIKKLNAEFDATASTATSLGLSLAPVRAEQEKQTKRFAQDFLDGMLDPQAVALRQLDDERKDSIASAEYIRDNVKDVYVDMARIADYWLKKKATLEAQFYEQSTGRLEDAIKRLTPGGDLANLDPRGTLAGIEASYAATRAQAFAGDQVAIGRLADEGLERAEYSRSYYAGSARYNQDRDAILQDLLALQAAMAPRATQGAGGAAIDAGAGGGAQMAQVLAVVEKQSEEITRLMNLLSRYVTNGLRATG